MAGSGDYMVDTDKPKEPFKQVCGLCKRPWTDDHHCHPRTLSLIEEQCRKAYREKHGHKI